MHQAAAALHLNGLALDQRFESVRVEFLFENVLGFNQLRICLKAFEKVVFDEILSLLHQKLLEFVRKTEGLAHS